MGGWVGRRAGLDDFGKSRPPPPQPSFDPWAIQLVLSRYTYWTITAHIKTRYSVYKFAILHINVLTINKSTVLLYCAFHLISGPALKKCVLCRILILPFQVVPFVLLILTEQSLLVKMPQSSLQIKKSSLIVILFMGHWKIVYSYLRR